MAGAGRSAEASPDRPLPIDVVTQGMAARRLTVRVEDVVFVKGVVDASEGLAAVFSDAGGELVLVAPLGREAELDRLIADLAAEVARTGGGDA